MDRTAFIAKHLAETSGFTIHLSPVQIFIGLSLLVVILLSNAKSLLFMWHVNISLPFPNPQCFSRILIVGTGTTPTSTCTASPTPAFTTYNKERRSWRREHLPASDNFLLHPAARYRLQLAQIQQHLLL